MTIVYEAAAHVYHVCIPAFYHGGGGCTIIFVELDTLPGQNNNIE